MLKPIQIAIVAMSSMAAFILRMPNKTRESPQRHRDTEKQLRNKYRQNFSIYLNIYFDSVSSVSLCLCGSVLLVALSACASQPTVTNQTVTSNTSGQTVAASPSPSPTVSTAPVAANSTAAGTGEPIDTSKYDAEIKRLEKQAEMRPGDDATRIALAKAYLARGNALTQARQYRAALGDYRRALRYDPDNEEARQWAATITGILQQMGREVPTEGNEPAPLPMTPDTIAGDEESSTKKEAAGKNSKQRVKDNKQ
jgi:tetratricopeptide (TPR) repeat protein